MRINRGFYENELNTNFSENNSTQICKSEMIKYRETQM